MPSWGRARGSSASREFEWLTSAAEAGFVRIEVRHPDGLIARPNLRDEGSDQEDEQVADLQFRRCLEWAVGHGVSAVPVRDGEGGYRVYGKQIAAQRSLAEGLLPLGLVQGLPLKHAIADGAYLKWSDVVYDPAALAVRVRREMETTFGRGTATM